MTSLNGVVVVLLLVGVNILALWLVVATRVTKREVLEIIRQREAEIAQVKKQLAAHRWKEKAS